MNSIKFMSVLFLFITFNLFSQDNLYSSLTIDPVLTKNANAVLRLDDTKIKIASIKNIKRSYLRIITILNKKGNNHLDAYVSYDDMVNVKKLKATVYNKFGKEVRKFKKGDFKDVAAVSNISLYEDSRVKYLEYTPTDYPYTVEFYYETESPNTAWIPFWWPIEGYLISTEKSKIDIVYDVSVGINKEENNFSDYNITDNSRNGVLSYTAQNLQALKPEELSPRFRETGPRLLITPENFYYESYTGSTGDWESLGKWVYDKLLVGRTNLPEDTKQEVINLVRDIKDPIEKAKIIYKYMQDNTRYISVQVGIGGIQPIAASDVDKVKYGDCKGLTNYTKALLDVVGVESYYTEVYAGREAQYSINKEFASLLGQTNHVILNIPYEGEDIWLECTSQKTPFGFIGEFTDDRDVFVIKPEGGEIKHTKKYTIDDNTQITRGEVSLSNYASIKVSTNINSKGIQYDNKYFLESATKRDLDLFYKNYWDYVNNISITKIDFLNDKDSVEFKEDIEFSAANYASVVGNRMLFNINVLNRSTYLPDRYRNRKMALKIYRSFKYVDEVEIHLPSDFKIESLPEPKTISTKFGVYGIEILIKDESTIIYKRNLETFEGEFPKEDYSDYRNFYKEVLKNDNSKIALIKNKD